MEVISEIVEAMDADVYGIVKEVIAYHDITIDANDVIEANDVSKAEEETEANHDFNDVPPFNDRPETPSILPTFS